MLRLMIYITSYILLVLHKYMQAGSLVIKRRDVKHVKKKLLDDNLDFNSSEIKIIIKKFIEFYYIMSIKTFNCNQSE